MPQTNIFISGILLPQTDALHLSAAGTFVANELLKVGKTMADISDNTRAANRKRKKQ